MPSPAKTPLLLVDDHAIVRSGLKQFLAEHVDLRVVGEASNGREAFCGSSFRVERACMELNPPTPGGLMAASEPPVRIMSALPQRM